MIEYSRDARLEEAVACVIRSLGLSHIDPTRVFIIRSRGSRSRALARIYSLPSAWRFALGIRPVYLIEVISERFDRLGPREKVAVIIHELLHIPAGFTGGLRPHGRLVNDRAVMALLARVDEGCVRLME